MRRHIHLSDRELLLMSDGELARWRAGFARKHLDACWACRERMRALEDTIAAFVRMRGREFAGQIPSDAGPRALLRARLAQANPVEAQWWRWNVKPLAFRFAIGVTFLSLAVAGIALLGPSANAAGQRPNSRVTPGETRPITLAEVCRSHDALVVVQNISEEKRRKVLAEYGVKEDDGAFEVDYLITPDLGGTETVRNLWPQPYSARWNAKTKDRLEQRLHDLVCSGKIDLRTAQREIASNWIQAYKQYVAGPQAP